MLTATAATAAIAALDRRRFMCRSGVGSTRRSPSRKCAGSCSRGRKFGWKKVSGTSVAPPDVNALFFGTPSARHVGRHPGDQFPLQVNCVFVRWHQAGRCCGRWLHLHEHRRRRQLDPGDHRRLPQLAVNRVLVRRHHAGGCCVWWLHLHELRQRRLVDPGNLRRLPQMGVNRVLVRRHQAGGWYV